MQLGEGRRGQGGAEHLPPPHPPPTGTVTPERCSLGWFLKSQLLPGPNPVLFLIDLEIKAEILQGSKRPYRGCLPLPRPLTPASLLAAPWAARTHSHLQAFAPPDPSAWNAVPVPICGQGSGPVCTSRLPLCPGVRHSITPPCSALILAPSPSESTLFICLHVCFVPPH